MIPIRSLPKRMQKEVQLEIDLDFSLRQAVAEAGEKLTDLLARRNTLKKAVNDIGPNNGRLHEELAALQTRSEDLQRQKVSSLQHLCIMSAIFLWHRTRMQQSQSDALSSWQRKMQCGRGCHEPLSCFTSPQDHHRKANKPYSLPFQSPSTLHRIYLGLQTLQCGIKSQ